MQNLKISLIIPAHNEEKEIGECLKSVIKNAEGLFSEIIVVDNVSTDRTAQLASGFPGVKVVREEAKGITRARQRGFMESKGDVLAFIDADNRMPEGWSEQISQSFQNDPNLGSLSGPYLYYDLPEWQQFLVKLYWYFLAQLAHLITGSVIVGGNVAMRRSVLEKMNGFDTSINFYGEDTDSGRRAKKFGKVKFSLEFKMYSSGRRLSQQGLFKTAYIYIINFLSEVLFKKPAHQSYVDIR
jgi:glycosyltransferase involved in cell wall biosynthesis